MLKHSRNKSAQSTAEYAILIGLVIAAAVAMQVYVKRGLQAQVHDVSVHLANQTTESHDLAGGTGLLQYEPDYVNSHFQVVRGSQADAVLDKPGNYQALDQSTVNRTSGYQRYEYNVEQEWGPHDGGTEIPGEEPIRPPPAEE